MSKCVGRVTRVGACCMPSPFSHGFVLYISYMLIPFCSSNFAHVTPCSPNLDSVRAVQYLTCHLLMVRIPTPHWHTTLFP